MGRPYMQEMSELADTYRHALSPPIDGLAGFVDSSLYAGLHAVGSGGSATACEFASVLHESATGTAARHVTPLELLDSRTFSERISVLMVSAGGGNKDILAAFDLAASRETANLGVLCAAGGDSKLSKRCSGLPSVFVHDEHVPHKDGFLATNSLLATCVWLARAYSPYLPDCTLPPDVDGLLRDCGAPDVYGMEGFSVYVDELLDRLSDASTIVVLHDMMGKAAAVDMESKLVEAGVCNVQPADYRNFAHGRHNWLDKHPADTGVIMLTSPGCAELARRTAALLPSNIPVAELHTGLDGPAAMISLLVQSMCAVGVLGRQSGIDPGRPGVADFGRELYNMGPPDPWK